MTTPPVPTGRDRRRRAPWRRDLYTIIFEADTRLGRIFDVALLWGIGLSVLAVMLESVGAIHVSFGGLLRGFEWAFTILFTIEYALRLIAAPRAPRYASSFFGIVDLLAIVPTYLSLFIAGTQSLLVIRALRLLRVFRVLKLVRYVGEAGMLAAAIRSSGRKILVFLGTVLTIQLIVGSLMFLIEGAESGFTSIPQSIYWAIVTMTTVGYGDIAPITVPGKILASAVMIIGYSVIAVPTGIVASEMSGQRKSTVTTCHCHHCVREGHDTDARFCKYCGGSLDQG
jgi:voltage-gated potassium channel